jgi:hypothetical protein
MIASLCDDLRISQELAPKLRHGLCSAADKWQRHMNDPTEGISPKDLTEGLIALSVALERAKSALGGITAAEWEMMRDGSALSNSDHYVSRICQRADAYDPVEEIRTISLDHTDVLVPDMIDALDALSNAAHMGTAPIGKIKRGPQPSFPLNSWTHSMFGLCSGTLRVPFTCDETQGMPVSPAACFCVNAFAVLSPQTPATRVLSAMKGAIHTQAETFLEISQNDV